MTSRPPNQSTSRPLRPKHSVRLGIECRLQANEPLVARDVLVVGAPESIELRRFLAVGADDPHAGQRLLNDRAHVRELRLDALEAVVDRLSEVARGDGHARAAG